MTEEMRAYLYACLSEECGETVQMVGKIQRFGEADHHPKTGNIPNRELLHNEYNEIIAVAEMLGFKRDPKLIGTKQKRVLKYAKYAGVI